MGKSTSSCWSGGITGTKPDYLDGSLFGAWSNRDDFELDEALTAARTLLSDIEFQSVRESGLNMTIEEANRFALHGDIMLPME